MIDNADVSRDPILNLNREQEIVEISKKLFTVSDEDFEVLKGIITVFEESSHPPTDPYKEENF